MPQPAAPHNGRTGSQLGLKILERCSARGALEAEEAVAAAGAVRGLGDRTRGGRYSCTVGAVVN